MINTLFLGVGETRTINAMRYNVVAKSLFPCSIRVLDKFGVERDRFDNVTSGFSFELDDQGIYRLEISNGIYAQDVKIYSGVFEVKNVNEFEYVYKGFKFCTYTSSEYSYYHIKNLSKYSLKITFTDNARVIIVFSNNNSVVGNELSTPLCQDMNNNNIISNIILVNGTHTAKPSFCYNSSLKREDYFVKFINSFLLPSHRGLILMNTVAGQSLNINLKIKF